MAPKYNDITTATTTTRIQPVCKRIWFSDCTKYAQSTGEAEIAVETVMNILKTERDKDIDLLAY